MEVLHQRCAGMDISKRDAKVCVRAPGARNNTFTKVVWVWHSELAPPLRLLVV